MLKRSSSLTERWQFECDGSVISVAATPNCSLIVAATVGRSVYLLDGEGNAVWIKSPERNETGLDHEAWSAAISDDGNVIAVGTANKKPADGTIYLYNARGDQIFAKTLGAPIWSLSLSENGRVVGVSCWNGVAYKFARKRAQYELVAEYSPKTTAGLYGLCINADATRGYVCAYDTGVIALDEEWRELGRYDCADGLYNISFANDAGMAVCGLRDGKILLLKTDLSAMQLKVRGCGRPICGIATSARGNVIAAGSFDGWIYVVGRTGTPFGRLETNGEVWSVACSDDAGLIVSGSGDNTVRMLDNSCSTAPADEINLFEMAVQPGAPDIETSLVRLIHAYTQYGLFEYGYIQLQNLLNTAEDTMPFVNASEQLLHTATAICDSHWWAHYELGLRAQELKRHRDAIVHFQKASRHPDYTSRAMTRCADSFTAKQLPTATAACYRRAREQHIDSDAKRVLYNLGRSYEDTKQWHQAISHFQLLASWDVGYRNTWERLEHLISIHGSIQPEETPRRADYTGITISLLGPNAPRDVDETLKDVLRARTAEVLIKRGEREKVSDIIQTLRANERFCRGITGTGLEYDQELFLKYDYALPEDETKKFLETVNLLYLLDGNIPKVTLDIGSATGRYPMLMKWFGAQACGIDIEPRAIEYAKAQLRPGDEWPKYVVGDARDLPFEPNSFDLITCMMGTFAHISSLNHAKVIAKMFKALMDGGKAAISTWDMECRHLAYLSIYNETQKDTIRTNSPTGDSLQTMLETAGFRDVRVRPFCMLPQNIIYDLGIENLRSGDIQLAAQADLAVRSLYPDKHGELFLVFGTK